MKIYVEGGGPGKAAETDCRQGFRCLLERAGFAHPSPAIKACGTRRSAFDDFATALRLSEPDVYPVLLVDSEAPVRKEPWEHLKDRDGWPRPDAAEDDQAQLLVQCMETWIVADQEAVERFFGQNLHANALPPAVDLENRSKDDVQESLERATRNCGRNRNYRKGKRSFDLLAQLDAEVLRKSLPHFRRLCTLLEEKL
ncbi:MAG TPA: DUF4276 family protein [Planctomycetota bacterium]|nr:DUF4276 family protein [Planctomycetota bacterium]